MKRVDAWEIISWEGDCFIRMAADYVFYTYCM